MATPYAPSGSAFLLAEAGLWDERSAATSDFLAPGFRSQYPEIKLDVSVRLVDEGGLVTAGAASAGLDLILHVARRQLGDKIADQTTRSLQFDEENRMLIEAKSQISQRRHKDSLVGAAQDWIEANFRDQLSLGALANELAVSQRSLYRRLSSTRTGTRDIAPSGARDQSPFPRSDSLPHPLPRGRVKAHHYRLQRR